MNISLNKFLKPGYTLIRTYTFLKFKNNLKKTITKKNKTKTNKKNNNNILI